jgi:hypothetical protein
MEGQEESSRTENFKQRVDLFLQFISAFAYPKGVSIAVFTEVIRKITLFWDVTPFSIAAVLSIL